MKVLLSVPMNRPPDDEVLLNDNGLGYIAAACEKTGVEVNLFSWNLNMSLSLFRKKLLDIQPDIFGLKLFTVNFIQAYETLKVVRETLPNVIIIIGGPHPSTSRPKDLFVEFDKLFDYAIAGDGECGLIELIKLIKSSGRNIAPEKLDQVPGLIYRIGDKVKFNKKCFDEDLDLLPQQNWDQQKPSWYSRKLAPDLSIVEQQTSESQPNSSNRRENESSANSVLFLDSRGCTAKCGHCLSWLINGSIPRKRKLESMIDELEMLIHKYDVRVLEFTGNSFLSNVDYVRELCKWLIKIDTSILWGCTVAANVNNILNPDLLKLMHQAGCTTIHFGIETGSPTVNKRLCKPISLPEYSKIVNLIVSEGIKAIGYFMFGFPDETLKEMNETIKFAMSLPFNKLSFCICLPLPATSSYEAILKQNNIDRIDWSKYNFNNPTLLPCKAKIWQVRRILFKAKVLNKFRSAAKFLSINTIIG